MENKGVIFPYLRAYGVSERQTDSFEKYQKFLLHENTKVNLTAITEPEEIEIKHFLDSLLLCGCKFWRESAEKEELPLRVADVGGGAGFPGVPLKLVYRQMALDTFEASQKKVDFLLALADLLSLEGTKAIHMRAEDAGQKPAYRENYDWVISRGVASVSVLLEYCLPLLRIGGFMAAYKGPAGRSEAEEGKKAAATLGGRLVDMVEAVLPESRGERSILIYHKVKATPVKYPRKPGIPARQPIR